MHDVNFKLWNGKEHALRFVGDFGGQWNLDWTQTKFCIINLLWRNFRLKSCVRSNPRSITQIAPKRVFYRVIIVQHAWCYFIVTRMTGDRDMSIVLLFDLQVGKIERRNEQSSISAVCVEPAWRRERLAWFSFSLANFGFPSLTEKL